MCENSSSIAYACQRPSLRFEAPGNRLPGSLSGFGMVVVAYDPYPRTACLGDSARAISPYVDPNHMSSLSDVIS